MRIYVYMHEYFNLRRQKGQRHSNREDHKLKLLAASRPTGSVIVLQRKTMADEEDNLVDYEEEALDEKGDEAGDEKEIKKYV